MNRGSIEWGPRRWGWDLFLWVFRWEASGGAVDTVEL
jgi:hypothetical protein